MINGCMLKQILYENIDDIFFAQYKSDFFFFGDKILKFDIGIPNDTTIRVALMTPFGDFLFIYLLIKCQNLVLVYQMTLSLESCYNGPLWTPFRQQEEVAQSNYSFLFLFFI